MHKQSQNWSGCSTLLISFEINKNILSIYYFPLHNYYPLLIHPVHVYSLHALLLVLLYCVSDFCMIETSKMSHFYNRYHCRRLNSCEVISSLLRADLQSWKNGWYTLSDLREK